MESKIRSKGKYFEIIRQEGKIRCPVCRKGWIVKGVCQKCGAIVKF